MRSTFMFPVLMVLAALSARADPEAHDEQSDADAERALAMIENSPAALPPPSPLGDVTDDADTLKFGRVDPVRVLIAGTMGAAACAAVSLPLGACGLTSGTYGAAMVVGALAAGVPIPLALTGVFAAYCIGVPSLFVAGPLSTGAAATGTVVGSRMMGNRVTMPVLVAMVPAGVLAVAGSVVAFIGTTWFTAAALGLDQTAIRASSALMAAGFLTTALSGPAAVLSTVVAAQLFQDVDEPALTTTEVPPSSSTHGAVARRGPSASSAHNF